MSGTASGLLLALPTLCFALVGFAAPTLAGRLGTHRTVLLALLVLIGGQVLRALAPGLAALFLGSVLGLAGAAVGNVLLPGLVRLHFPQSIPAVTAGYTTLLTLGGTMGAGLTLPIEHALGGDWRTGIGMWAVTAVVAIVPWIVMAMPRPPRPGHAGPGDPPVCGRWPGHRWRGRWPASSARSHCRRTSSSAGFRRSTRRPVFPTRRRPPRSRSSPASASRSRRSCPGCSAGCRRQAELVVGFGICCTAGYLGLILAPASVPWLFSLLLGVGGGAFPMSLTLIALRTRTPQGTIALSGFTQSAGYLIASIGPIGFGFLHDQTGGWTIPLIALIGVVVVMVACGLRVVRKRTLEDEISVASRAGPSPA